MISNAAFPVADPAGKSAVTLSAVICTYDRYPLLGEAIESLLRQQTGDEAVEIIVVDNSPNHDTAAEFAARYAGVPGLSYVIEPRPGLANARNVGMREASGRIVAYIDDDARAAPSWIGQLIRAYGVIGDTAGAVGGRVQPRWSVPPPEWLAPELFGYLSVLDLGTEMRDLTAGEYLCGCNLSFDRDALISIGGFSTSLGRRGSEAALLSNEELDVCNRLLALGRRVVYAPEAAVEHLIPAERLTRRWFRRRACWQAVSDMLMTPDRSAEIAAAASRLLTRNRRARDPMRLFSETSDPSAFQEELHILSSLVGLALCGGPQAESPRGVAGRIFQRLGLDSRAADLSSPSRARPDMGENG
jgi:GT2 family glycosyltransferase